MNEHDGDFECGSCPPGRTLLNAEDKLCWRCGGTNLVDKRPNLGARIGAGPFNVPIKSGSETEWLSCDNVMLAQDGEPSKPTVLAGGGVPRPRALIDAQDSENERISKFVESAMRVERAMQAARAASAPPTAAAGRFYRGAFSCGDDACWCQGLSR